MYSGLGLVRTLIELAESVNVKRDGAEIAATSHSTDKYKIYLSWKSHCHSLL